MYDRQIEKCPSSGTNQGRARGRVRARYSPITGRTTVSAVPCQTSTRGPMQRGSNPHGEESTRASSMNPETPWRVASRKSRQSSRRSDVLRSAA